MIRTPPRGAGPTDAGPSALCRAGSAFALTEVAVAIRLRSVVVGEIARRAPEPRSSAGLSARCGGSAFKAMGFSYARSQRSRQAEHEVSRTRAKLACTGTRHRYFAASRALTSDSFDI